METSYRHDVDENSRKQIQPLHRLHKNLLSVKG